MMNEVYGKTIKNIIKSSPNENWMITVKINFTDGTSLNIVYEDAYDNSYIEYEKVD